MVAHCPKSCSKECIQALTGTVAGAGDTALSPSPADVSVAREDDSVVPETEGTVTAMQARIEDANRRLDKLWKAKTVDEDDAAAANEDINEEISESVDAMDSKLNGQLSNLWARVFG
jgi:hypothetical protein